MGLDKEDVEKYLDENEDFTKSYFERKATSSMVDHWLANRSHRPGSRAMQVNHVRRDMKPERKSLGSTVLPSEKFKSFLDDDIAVHAPPVKPRRKPELGILDEKELFMELIRDIANELDINRLSHKILVNVSILTNADRCSLFLVQGSRDHKVLVSKLFDVTADSTVQESIRSEDDQIVVPLGVGIAGHTALTGETINIKDAYLDPRFNSNVDKATGYKTHSILCMAIKSHDGEVVGVAQTINKKTGEHVFTESDVSVFGNYLTFCGIGITNAQLFEISVQEYKRNQVLLQLAHGIFEEQSDLDKCMHNIMMEAQELLHCERCMVFLIDESVENEVVFSKAFDLNTGSGSENKATASLQNAHWCMNSGIAALVASTGEALNIPDAYADSRFNPEGDQESGYKTKSILCMPIFDTKQKIVGVAQLLNKLDGKPFTDSDVSLFEAFAIFCGLGIHNTLMFEQKCKLLAKQSVAMEVLSYHASAQQAEVDHILSLKVPTPSQIGLYTFEFSDFEITDDETVLASFAIFQELDLLNTMHIRKETLFRWILSVKKNYRPVIYHNWRHAFNVAQSMFVMLTTGTMAKYFPIMEQFALLIGCFCHDLDHRGTNNAFQSKIDSPLAELYGTSTMEHHHFDHCIMILNSKGNNILSELSPEDYREAIKLLEHAILSTDLALYFKKRSDFEKVTHCGNPDWSLDTNRELLRAMMMTACDVAAITKPWPIQQQVAELVASEFFEQGDLEREKLHSEPIAMMDRRKKEELPKMQVGFIDFICMTLYELFYDVDPALKPLYDGCVDNRKNWQNLADERENAKNKPPGNGVQTTSSEPHKTNGTTKNKERTSQGAEKPDDRKRSKEEVMKIEKKISATIQRVGADADRTEKKSRFCLLF